MCPLIHIYISHSDSTFTNTLRLQRTQRKKSLMKLCNKSNPFMVKSAKLWAIVNIILIINTLNIPTKFLLLDLDTQRENYICTKDSSDEGSIRMKPQLLCRYCVSIRCMAGNLIALKCIQWYRPRPIPFAYNHLPNAID